MTVWDSLPWERIERATSYVAGVMQSYAEDVPDIRADITLGTYLRLVEGIPLERALSRAVTQARNNLVRNRVCGMTGRWSGLAIITLVGEQYIPETESPESHAPGKRR